jgi:hypothetical protein
MSNELLFPLQAFSLARYALLNIANVHYYQAAGHCADDQKVKIVTLSPRGDGTSESKRHCPQSILSQRDKSNKNQIKYTL